MNLSAEQSLSLLRDSLTEAQETVRAYDIKAQIVGVGYIFALGVVGNFEALLPEASELNLLTLSVACGVIIPILLFGFVLSAFDPKRTLSIFAHRYRTRAADLLRLQ